MLVQKLKQILAGDEAFSNDDGYPEESEGTSEETEKEKEEGWEDDLEDEFGEDDDEE